MIDAVTSDEDKVAPVYKLEEICQLLRSSHFSIVKEMSDFVLKRSYHKSPIVKQKDNVMLKEQVEALIQENTILKRAVSTRHERQKEYEDRGQELQHLKQLIGQYREQLRTFEVELSTILWMDESLV